MAGTEIYIALDNTNIYFNEKSFIPIQDTNIPKEHLIFRSHEPILWKVEMLEYDGASKCLRVRVVDYHSNDISAFNRQEPKKRIDKILFERFDWSNFEPLLSSYQKQKLMSILSNIDANLFSKGDMPHIERKKMEAFSVMDYSQNQEERAGYSVADIDKSIVSPHFKSLIATKILVEFSVGISEVKFNLGYVSITKAIKEIDQIINFKISNDNILAEFDCIEVV